MLKTTITYSIYGAQFRRLGLLMTPLHNGLTEQVGMQVDVTNGEVSPLSSEVICKVLLDGYQAWSESPLALSLRTLATFHTECRDSIPSELMEGEVTAMTISIDYTSVEKKAWSTLTSVSLTKDADLGTTYLISHQCERQSVWAIEPPSPDANVMCIALKLLAFEQATGIDIHRYPAAPDVHIGLNALQHRKSIDELVPEYAREAFRMFMTLSMRPPNSDDPQGCKKLWELFRRT